MWQMDETPEAPRDPEAIVNAFLQHKSMEQMQDSLARGRRFAQLDIGRLKKDWIIAVSSWLAHKDRTKELMKYDLAAEVRFPGLEPPYGDDEENLVGCAAQASADQGKKPVIGV